MRIGRNDPKSKEIDNGGMKVVKVQSGFHAFRPVQQIDIAIAGAAQHQSNRHTGCCDTTGDADRGMSAEIEDGRIPRGVHVVIVRTYVNLRR